MPKSEYLSRSLEINAIKTFDREFPTIFNKSCTYITFKSAVKHRQLGYGYPHQSGDRASVGSSVVVNNSIPQSQIQLNTNIQAVAVKET